MSVRFTQRLENLHKAAAVFDRRLQAYKILADDEGNQMALIQSYEVVLELCWKTLKDYLESQGHTDIASPKSILRNAFVAHIITDGDTWIQALSIRNLTSHTYLDSAMTEILEFIHFKFVKLLHDLLDFFKNHTASTLR